MNMLPKRYKDPLSGLKTNDAKIFMVRYISVNLFIKGFFVEMQFYIKSLFSEQLFLLYKHRRRSMGDLS